MADLPGYRLAIAEQEEQSQQGEGEQGQAPGELIDHHPADIGDMAAGQALDQLPRAARIRQILLPPFLGLPLQEGQVFHHIRLGDAVGLNIMQPFGGMVGFMGHLDRHQREGRDEDQRHPQREDQGHQNIVAAGPEALGRAAIKRPQRDGEDAGPDQGA